MLIRRLPSDGYLNKILNARVYDVAKETELQYAPVLSAQFRKLGRTVLLSLRSWGRWLIAP